MFRDYQDDIQVDLCFQAFEQELADMPGKYQCVLLADGGCVALRPFAAGVVELKRLFVYPASRGLGLGRVLAEAAIAEAVGMGYGRMRLDTIEAKMPSAVRLYETLGFERRPPLDDGLLVMELDLLALAAKPGN
jgi:putative acetyltransferase